LLFLSFKIALKFKYNRIPFKVRLIIPAGILIFSVIAITAFFFIRFSINTFVRHIEANLETEVQTITKMFERERNLKQEKVTSSLKIAHHLFYNSRFAQSNEYYTIQVENQETSELDTVVLNTWYLHGKKIFDSFFFVDSIQALTNSFVTIFQKTDIGFVRISTNVLKKDSTRATKTYIPLHSPVVSTILKGETYYGRAFVVNDWYITAYEPIYSNNEIIGILYVGDKEKDLDELRKILYELKIGKSGYSFVIDNEGNVLIHPLFEGQNWKDSSLFKSFSQQTKSILHYTLNGTNKISCYHYDSEFDIYIAATVTKEAETNDFYHKTLFATSLIAIIVMIVLIALFYYLSAEKIYSFLRQLEISNNKLLTARQALKQSEDRFRKLFDSTGDDIFVTDENENIIEVNQSACISLGYERDELLKLKIVDIKTSKYVERVSENRAKIFEAGRFSFESEHVTKDGRVLQVEFTSRVVDYNNEKLILSVVRNIGLRKEFERQVLGAVIKTEERERERFAKDMHDGLGPLLSTIKLYVDEMKSPALNDQERIDLAATSIELIDEAVASTRNISNNLMPRIINKYGISKAIESFCEKVNKTNKIHISFEHDNIPIDFNKDMELIVFRVVSELINNTIKHAGATNISLLLIKNESKLLLFFKDDGVGFDLQSVMVAENKGMGLKNIISRIRSINGAYKFDSSPGNGFSIKIEIDL
jgi:PAS domain S-box-containing protein